MTESAHPVYVPVAKVKEHFGGALSPASVLRLEVADPTFPRLLRVSPRKTLIDLNKLAAWLEANEGQPVAESIRGRAEVAHG